RGASVVVLAANVGLPDPAGVRVVAVESAAEMHEAILKEAQAADAVVMAAAVADYRPAEYASVKLKKEAEEAERTLRLVTNPDILSQLVATRPPGQIVVGFAAET